MPRSSSRKVKVVPMDIHAPFSSTVRYLVGEGDTVITGARLATVETVKLEAAIQAPGPGQVTTLDFSDFDEVAGGDRILVLEAEA